MRRFENLLSVPALRAVIATSAMLLFPSASLPGALIVEESFIFTASNLQGQGSGTGWSGGWQTGIGGSDMVTVPGLVQENGGQLAVRGEALTDSANAASTVYRNMAAPLRENVVYLSYLARYANAFSSYVGLGTEVHDYVYSGASFRIARLEGSGQLGWWDPVASSWKSSGLGLVTDRTYLIVVKAVKGGSAWGGGDDSLSFWVDPTPGAAEPAPDWTQSGLNFGTLDTSRVLLGTNWNGPTLDEFRLGTDWASVTPAAPQEATVTVNAVNGTVTIDPQQPSYTFGTEVTLTATPSSGFLFAGWSGDVNGLGNPVSVAVTANLNVTANFVEASQGLSITVATQNGTVVIEPLKESYAEGEVVKLTAVADPGYRFDGWNDAVLDYRISATVTMVDDLLVAPRFVLAPHGAGGVGANVREDFVKQVLHVDAATGSDANPGTEQQPFATIKRAFARAEQLLAQNIGIKVLIHPGLYREEVRVPAAQFTAPLVIEGAGWTPTSGNTGDVIITGAAPLEGLTLNSDGVYEVAWPHNWGFQADPFDWAETPTPPAMLRFEWIVLGNNPFLHVFDYQTLLAEDGYHVFVDEANDKLYLKGPAGLDLAGAGVEMTRFASGSPNNANFLMWIKGSSTNMRSHIVVRNLVFEKGSPGAFRAALHIHEVNNVLVEDVVGRLNHSVGVLADAADYTTLRNIEVHDNTIQGMGFGQTEQGRIERAHIHNNCKVATAVGYTGWAPCGMKNGDLQHSSMVDLLFEDNHNHGLWLDTGTKYVEVTRLRSVNNGRNGVYYENNNRNNMPGLGATKTAVIRQSVIAGNGEKSTIHTLTNGATRGGSGLFYVESENLYLEEVVIFNHDENIAIAYNNRGPISNFVMTASVVGEPAGDSTLLYRQIGNMVAWQEFFDTMSSDLDYNIYYDQDVRPFIGRALPPLSLNEWQEALATNPFNPNLPISPELNSVHISDYDRTDFRILGVEALVESIAEGDTGVAALRFTRVQADVSTPLILDYTVDTAAGRAGAADFAEGLNGTITIPAGAMHADLVLSPLADGLAEGPEILVVGIGPVEGYDQFFVEAAVSVIDNEVTDLPLINIAARESRVTERNRMVSFDLARDGDLSAPLTVALGVDGTGTAGADWSAASTEVTFAAGEAAAVFEVALIDDAQAELPETLVVRVLRSDDLVYAPGRDAEATVTVDDNDLVDRGAVVVSDPIEGRAGSFDLTFSNPTDDPYSYSVAPFANAWDIQEDADLNWTNPTGSPVLFNYVVNNNDGVSAALPIGFSFPFFGQSHDTVRIHTNGFLTFVPLSDPSGTYRVPLTLPLDAPGSVNPYMIAAYWRNWELDSTSRVFAHTDAHGNFVVTWRDLYQSPAFPTKRRATWQVVLHRSGQIEYRYLSDATSGSYVIGLQGADASEGLTLAESGLAAAGVRVILTPLSAFLSAIPGQIEIAGSSQQTVSFASSSLNVLPGVYDYALSYRPSDLSLPALELSLQFRVGAALSAAHWPQSISYGDFQTWVDGFGWVYDELYPFIHHESHGWLYLPLEPDTTALVYYDYGKGGFAWTSIGGGGVYPWISWLDDGTWSWSYYVRGTAAPRHLWTTGGWTGLP